MAESLPYLVTSINPVDSESSPNSKQDKCKGHHIETDHIQILMSNKFFKQLEKRKKNIIHQGTNMKIYYNLLVRNNINNDTIEWHL